MSVIVIVFFDVHVSHKQIVYLLKAVSLVPPVGLLLHMQRNIFLEFI